MMGQKNKTDYKHREALTLEIKFASLFFVYKNLLNIDVYDKIITVVKIHELSQKINQDISFEQVYNHFINEKIEIVLLKGFLNPITLNINRTEFKKMWEDFNEKYYCD